MDCGVQFGMSQALSTSFIGVGCSRTIGRPVSSDAAQLPWRSYFCLPFFLKDAIRTAFDRSARVVVHMSLKERPPMDSSAVNPDLVTIARRCATFSVPAILALSSAACGGGDGGPKYSFGLYVYCNGNPDGLYYDNPLLNEPVPRFSLPCIDPNEFGETGGIDLDEWTNDTESIEQLRSMCVEECRYNSTGTLGNCEQDMGKLWQIENYKGIPVPDPLMLIDDPAHLECQLSPDTPPSTPWGRSVIPVYSSPLWPSNGQAITLACGDYQTCAEEFLAPIGVGLYYNDTDAPWRADMGAADHLVTTSPGRSAVTITLENPGATPSSDSNTVEHGRVEYSAPDCGEPACPFYLANLTLANTSDTWEFYSNVLMDEVQVTSVSVQLRQPTLGAWNTSTGEFYIGKQRVELWVEGTLQIGAGSRLTESYLVANPDAVFGRIGPGGEIELLDFAIEDSEFVIEADLDYDTRSGSPPIADHGLGSTVAAPYSAGLPISAIADDSWDPDGDIDETIWIVDGTKRTAKDTISTGMHTIELWVRDERGALDVHESAVLIEAP
jgi:hypothetical protein